MYNICVIIGNWGSFNKKDWGWHLELSLFLVNNLMEIDLNPKHKELYFSSYFVSKNASSS